MEKREQPLVSMITYCYNGERFIQTYFQALLAQTYSNIELFFYNNGSADRTGEIAESYRAALTKKGIRVNIEHFETNQVTCSLKQRAFLQMKGKYFFGVDSDDIITDNHVQVMVEYLEQHPDKSTVFGKLITVKEGTGEELGLMQVLPKNGKQLFMDCLMSRNMIYTPIAYMIRTEDFCRVNHGREIYQTRFGENYQILLPLLYEGNIGILDEVVGRYLIRADSYTAALLDPQKKITALDEQIKTIFHTLQRMEIPDAGKYQKAAEARLRADALLVSYKTGDSALAKQRYRLLRSTGGMKLTDYARYVRFCIKNRVKD